MGIPVLGRSSGLVAMFLFKCPNMFLLPIYFISQLFTSQSEFPPTPFCKLKSGVINEHNIYFKCLNKLYSRTKYIQYMIRPVPIPGAGFTLRLSVSRRVNRTCCAGARSAAAGRTTLFDGRGEERISVPFPVSAKMAALAAAAGRPVLGRLVAATAAAAVTGTGRCWCADPRVWGQWCRQ